MASAVLESNTCASVLRQTSPTIQVSLLPPPCEEFTTSEPLLSATRVSPPRDTYVPSPLRMNGLRSRWRGSTAPSHSVGAVDSRTIGWATKLRGLASTASLQCASSAACRGLEEARVALERRVRCSG